MKRLLVAALIAVPLAGGLLAAPAQAASESRGALVFNAGDGWVCGDGYDNFTINTVKVVTKAGKESVSCHFRAGETNWPLGTRYSERGYDDCRIIDFYGNVAVLDSHFEVTPDGAARMTCN